MANSTGTEPTQPTGVTEPSATEPAGPAIDGAASSPISAKTADFPELATAALATGAASLDNLLDVTVQVTAELGRTTTSIGELLKLNVGSVVELDRLVSQPVDLLAQGVRLARGEVVVVEDRFAIRIKEIVDPKKRPNGNAA